MAPRILSSLFGGAGKAQQQASPSKPSPRPVKADKSPKDTDSEDEAPRFITVDGDGKNETELFKVSGNGKSDAWCMY